jgi:hypothetical protein
VAFWPADLITDDQRRHALKAQAGPERHIGRKVLA